MSRSDFIGSEYGSQRLANGITTFSQALKMLLGRNNLTHEELVALSRWANPWGQTWLSTSQISYLRTGVLKKAGPQTLDALGQVNLRLAEAAGCQVDGLPDFGSMPSEVRPEYPWYLRQPNTHEPLDTGGLYLIWIGRLRPDGLDEGHISDMEARRLSGNLERIVQGWARDQRLTLNEALDVATAAHGATDKRRQQKLKAVICGFEVYSGDEFTEELPAFGAMLGAMDNVDPLAPTEVRTRLYKLPKD
jgi:hypothetical protein